MACHQRVGITVFALICSFVAASQASSIPVPLIPADEQQMIEAFLADYATEPTVVVSTTRSGDVDVDAVNLQLAARGQGIAASVRQNFKTKRESDCRIRTQLNIKHLRFLTREEETRMFRSRDGWAEFHRRYGKNASLVTVSRVGLNAEKTLALLYVTSGVGRMGGSGWVYTYERTGGKWVRKAAVAAWNT